MAAGPELMAFAHHVLGTIGVGLAGSGNAGAKLLRFTDHRLAVFVRGAGRPGAATASGHLALKTLLAVGVDLALTVLGEGA